MIANLKPYPVYKDSGVPWLGKVPEHWEIRRLRNVVDMRVSNVDKHTKEGELPVRLCNYVNVYKNDQITENIPFMRATATAEEIERFRLELGDVLITKDSETWDDIGVPALVEFSAEDLICGYHLALLRPQKGLLGAYLFRALQSSTIAYQFNIAANGVTRYGLSHDAIKSVLLPVPPLPEQSAIVHYLGYINLRIQRHIRTKQKLIKLLEEQKQAIIHRAVTRGLDPNVRLKPSGIALLGDVPEHWEVTRLKTVLSQSMRNGLFKKKDAFGEGVPLVNVKDIYNDGFQIDHGLLERIQATPNETRIYQVQSGDLFFVRSSLKLEGTGRSAVALGCEPNTVFECHLVQARPNQLRANSRFLAFQLNSYLHYHYFISCANVVTMATIAQDVLSSCPVVLPPMPEQKNLLRLIDIHCKQTNVAIDQAKREIELLREYRTRLITEVITGKLDVSEVASNLQIEVGVPELFDEIDALRESAEETGNGLEATTEEAEA